MNSEIDQLIEQLKTVSTGPEIARATVKLLRACGVYNFQGVAQNDGANERHPRTGVTTMKKRNRDVKVRSIEIVIADTCVLHRMIRRTICGC